MSPETASVEAADLEAARAAYAAGLYAQAHRAALTQWRAGGEGRGAAGRLAVHASFRLGEYGAASDLLAPVMAETGLSATTQDRFDLLAVAVVVHGELADYAASIAALRQLHDHSARLASLPNHVRARGTAAVCLALLGDCWAALRLLAEAAEHLRSMPDAAALEATVRSNQASSCLQAARLALQAGDTAAFDAQLVDADASTARTCELAAQLGDSRMAAFADVHAAESALLRGRAADALGLLQPALAQARASGLDGHVRRLMLLQAQAQLARADAAAADATLDQVLLSLHEGHDWSSRLEWFEQRHATQRALGDMSSALEALQAWRALASRRHARQLEAQSRFLRLRLELEHLYRQPWRSGG